MFDFSPEAGLWGLFASAFVSATILPGSSEVVLVVLLAKYPDTFWTAIAVATVGNTLGGVSWVPVIGDALCVAAGWLRFNAWLCMLLLAVGKLLRYVLIAGGWVWFR